MLIDSRTLSREEEIRSDACIASGGPDTVCLAKHFLTNDIRSNGRLWKQRQQQYSILRLLSIQKILTK
jgi:hypothetical protein